MLECLCSPSHTAHHSRFNIHTWFPSCVTGLGKGNLTFSISSFSVAHDVLLIIGMISGKPAGNVGLVPGAGNTFSVSLTARVLVRLFATLVVPTLAVILPLTTRLICCLENNNKKEEERHYAFLVMCNFSVKLL